jgi:thiamine kinase-like enzyme
MVYYIKDILEEFIMINNTPRIPLLCSVEPQAFIEATTPLIMPNQPSEFSRQLERCLIHAKIWHEIKISADTIFNESDTHLLAAFEELKGGLTNTCFRLRTNKGNFFLRVPGKGSEDHLSREDEAYNLNLVKNMNFNIEIFFLNPKTGLYVGEYLESVTALSPDVLSKRQTMKDVASIFKVLHNSNILFKNTLSIFGRLKDLLHKINQRHHPLSQDPHQLVQRIKDLKRICEQDASPYVPCHNDPTYLNFLYQGRQLKLLDWEYSGNNKALFDLANFAITAELSKDSQQQLLQAYYHQSPTQQLWQVFSAYKQATDLWYYLWAELQLANQSNVVPRQELRDLTEKHWNRVMGSSINLPKPHVLALNF